jgi:hypothetical protein
MSLIERLRRAEQKGRDFARKQRERARDALAENETRLRRKMRLHPRPERPAPAPSGLPEPVEPPIASSGPAAIEDLPHRASEEDAA